MLEIPGPYAQLWERSPQGMLVVGLDGLVLRANPAACALLGGTEPNLVGSPVSTYVVDDEASRAAAHERGRHGTSAGVLRFRRRDGSVFPAEFTGTTATLVREGRPPFELFQFREISERQAELQALFDSSLDGFWLVSGDGRILEANPAACAMLGYAREEMLGLAIRDIDADEAPAELEAHHRKIVAAGKDRFHARHRRRDGTAIDVEVSVHRTALGGASFAAFVRNLTDQRAAERRAEESARLAALGTLVAGVAHEINNPLTGVTAGLGVAIEDVEVLRSDLAAGVPLDAAAIRRRLDELLEALHDAQQNGQRIGGIVRDLSLFGRPDPARARVRLTEVVNEAVAMLPRAVRRSFRLAVEVADAPDVLGSTGQLAQVLVNLVTNAALSGARGREVSVVVASGSSGTGGAFVEVRDDGQGIPPHVLPHVFEPFFTTRRNEGGTGLGLAISHAIASAHGGTLTVTTRVGVGTTFRMELPAA
ncbi:MAG TPA: PAS domain S-box protein [Anaeromyxobacteraceae bacterium]|nr:PAS domain S-box protein [Anaeromyxobacteraceae bacterium]